MASTYLTRTFSSAGNRKTWTMSAWIKRTKLEPSSDIRVFGWKSGGGNYGYQFDSDKFRFYLCSGGSGAEFLTYRKFTDTNAWYHIQVACDTTQSTASDRFKLYVNGVQETAFSTETYPNQNEDTAVNQAEVCRLGCSTVAVNSHFDGLMSHVYFIDGTALPASTFGSTDSTTGEWQINTSPTISSYGTNGFSVLKDGNTITDQSPNSNDFSLGAGTLTKSEDCPSNVFATLDYLNYKTSTLTYSNGNTTVSFPGAWVFALGNLGVSSGKYYWEAKVNSGNNANSYYGICAEMVPEGAGFYNNSQNGAIMYAAGDSGDTYIDGSYTSGGHSPQNKNTDILGLALDLDSGTKTLKIYKNGTQLTSGGTINLSSYYNDTLVFPCFSGNSSSASCSFNVNFGNGYFGTTAVSSAGTNASGIGIFEYDVPAGYTALSTKGLNE